jgi:hypothetical protein
MSRKVICGDWDASRPNSGEFHRSARRYLSTTNSPARPALSGPNKTTALLKDAILQAATKAGGGDLVEYLSGQAE